MGTNNKLREAVKKLLDVLYDMGVDENTLAIAIESPNCQMKSEYTLSVLKEARAALAAPPRNCDVGTATEQSDRMRRSCLCVKGGCRECPRRNDTFRECVIYWGQMPYVASERGEVDDTNG